MAKSTGVLKPKTDERTGKQAPKNATKAAWWPTSIPGFGPAAPGTYKTYRRMRGNPTIALARAAATAPIRITPISFTIEDNAKEEWLTFVQQQIDALWPRFIREALFALDYGWQSFEKVWEPVKFGGRTLYGYRKLKMLLPEITTILEDDSNGSFAGLQQKDVALDVAESFVFSYDSEAGNPYGRSRHENIREWAWHPWTQLAEKRAQYATKVAGVIPIMRYPIGEAKDETGALKSNFDIAQAVLKHLGQGHGIAMPQELATWAEDLLAKGIDPTQLAAWTISFLETSGSHGDEITSMMRHGESLLARGWLVPERAITEGQMGTKAEAESQGELGVVIAGLVLDDIIRDANKYIVNPLLEVNFGEEAQDAVKIEPGKLDTGMKAFTRGLATAVLGNPSNVDLFMRWIDVDAFIDQAGLPKAEETIDTTDDLPNRDAGPAAGDGSPPTPDLGATLKEALTNGMERK